MNGKYQQHDAYRDSGVLHLREVPQGWKTKQLKRSIEGCVNGAWGGEPTGGDEDIVVIRVADFDRPRLGVKDVEYTKRAVAEKERDRRLLKAGDLLLEKSGGGEKTQVGQVVLFDREFEAVCSNFVAKMTPLDGYDSSYLNYSFSALYRDGINSCSIKQNTGIQNLDSNSYLAEHWAFPCLEEQIQIAKFLDYETAKIDALLEKQQQLIALLKEKRQAVISHAVTKGFNPNVPMRDSGVEWLGEVPAHWEVKQIRHLTAQLGGGTPSKDNANFWNGDVPWVSPKDMKVDYISDSQDTVTETAILRSAAKIIPVGSVLIVVRGMILDHSVPTALTVEPLTINQDMKALVPMRHLDAEFLLFALKGLKDYLLSHTNSSAHGTKCIATERLERLSIALPGLDEQRTLVRELKEQLARIDSLSESANGVIELIQERRTALISAAVTGKIDVRCWKPPESETEAAAA